MAIRWHGEEPIARMLAATSSGDKAGGFTRGSLDQGNSVETAI
jgi:hypothetical protein